MSNANLRAWLDEMRQLGILRRAPTHTPEGGFIIPYATDAVALPDAGSMTCYHAALVSATGCGRELLGLDPIEVDSSRGALYQSASFEMVRLCIQLLTSTQSLYYT